MIRLASKARTAWALGPANLARVLFYRAALRLGIHPSQRLSARLDTGDVFASPSVPAIDATGNTAWQDIAHLFGHIEMAIGDDPPDWFAAVRTGCRHPTPGAPWWTIPDFTETVGDIKLVWEASRMDWAIPFAQRAQAGDARSLNRLNAWLSDWSLRNPPYHGPNWKCAQEASIRILHLATAAIILRSDETLAPSARSFVRAHLRRIAATLSYATAQDNNHATSEAAALFIGGSWLESVGDADGPRWAALGRSQLEQHIRRLFARDGSFSQHSTNYHRLALDTLSMVELWRHRRQLAPFSQPYLDRVRAAAAWLRAMIDEKSGQVPNIGANDSANLLPLTNSDPRDFRPSAQLATILFEGATAFPTSPQDEALAWLDLSPPAASVPSPGSQSFDDGGYGILRRGSIMAILRYPRFRFRPSQSDALHVDLWVAGHNLLRDGGSYSYNDGDEWIDYFGGTASHNSVQFDHVDQVPRLGRFLLGDWLKTAYVDPLLEGPGTSKFGAGYRNRLGHNHHRTITLAADRLVVEDTVAGFRTGAVLRWRLPPGEWVVSDMDAAGPKMGIAISASVPVRRIDIVTGYESQRYLEKTELPVLEVEIDEPGTLTSIIRWTV